jgi:serine/threonine protein kinase
MTHTPRSPTPVPSTRVPSDEVTRAGAVDEVAASPRAGGCEPVLDNRFVLLEPLGEGGHAIVWRARDRLMRTMVAVKILRALDPEWQRRFALEAEVLANLHHANVVRAIARGRTPEGQPYVVLELVEGQSLRTRLDAGGPLPWREVIEIGIQAAAALTALHSRGVIHRDVKPGNLMRTIDDGGGLVIKLIDFGVARLNSDWDELPGATPATPRRQTDAGMAIGTPAYMPMEAGLVPPNERFDVHSLGVTLYELCTGAQPGIEPVRPLGEVNPVCDAPADLAVVLAAALALEPGDRTQTAAELGRALAAVRAAHPEHRPSSLFDGRYERLAVMGTGARGEVFHAVHRGSGHEVALKLLRSAHPDDAHRFRREAQLLALLNHPCIPRFYDYVQVAETPYISMARAPGVPAVKFCRLTDANRLSFAEVAHVGLQLAGVLAHVHARGILHRDVNANNVLIDLQRSPRVMLLDFGNAALTEQFYSVVAGRRYLTPPESRVVIPDGGIETLAWAAPEARAGQGFTDKSDVYSLGLLLFRLITGTMPMTKGQDAPVSPRVYARACPDDLAFAILGALNPDPKERPSAAELAARLEDVLAADEDVPATAPALPVASDPPAPPAPAVQEPLAGTTRGWTRFMAATAEPANVGPGPSSAAPPEGAAKVLPFHPRDILERATTLEPDFAPAVVPAVPAAVVPAVPAAIVPAVPAAIVPPAPWRARAAGVAVLLLSAAVFLSWATGRSGNQSATGATASTWASQTPEPSQLPEPAAAAPATPPAAPRTETGAPLPAMLDALKQVSGPLLDCVRLAGGVLIVEFKTAEHRERFAGTRVVGEESPAVLRCVDEAVAPVRFAPAPVQTITEEFIL